jgi:hypothetical protein
MRKSRVITLWGHRYDENNPFKDMLIIDSDDNKNTRDASKAPDTLTYHEVVKRDGMWWFKCDQREW